MNRLAKGSLSKWVACLSLAAALCGCGQKDAGSAGATGASPGGGASPAGPAPEIAGDYTVKGTNPGGGDYTGSLAIAKRGDVYQFSWKSGATSYDGVGVQMDKSVGVAFATGSNGKGCSVIHYLVTRDGALSGRWGAWGENAIGSEGAARKAPGTGLEGTYDVTGKRLDGNPYKGSLTVAAQGAGFLFDWNTGDVSQGFGIRMGNFVSVGIGGDQCGFVNYEVKPDGTLNGQWSSFKSKAIGTEVATKSK